MLTRTYWHWSAGVQLARLPTAMAPLAFTSLTTAVTGSYRLGGAMMAAYVVAEMAGAVPVGRLLDHVGAARGLRVLLILVATGQATLGIAATSGTTGPALPTLALLPGLAGGALSGGFRSLLATVVGPDQLTRAVAVDAMLLDGVLVVGPLLVSALVLTGPLTPLLAMASASAAAALLVPTATGSRRRRAGPAEGAPSTQPGADTGGRARGDCAAAGGGAGGNGGVGVGAGAGGNGGVGAGGSAGRDDRVGAGGGACVGVGKPVGGKAGGRVGGRAKFPLKACLPWLACQFTVGLLLSTIEVAPLPLVERVGASAGAAPVVVAVLCGASIGGGAVYAWRNRGGPRWFLVAFVAGGSLVAANLGWPGLIAGVVLVGSATGPLVTIASVQLQRLLPEGRRSEGFSVSFTVQSCGYGLGSLAVGVLPLWMAPLLGVAATIGCLARPFPRGGDGCDAGAEPRATIGTASATS